MSSPCPVCETPSEKGANGDVQQVACPRCGPFLITGTARAMLGSRLDDNPKAFARISHAIRTRTSAANWFRVDSANIDELAQAPLPSVRIQSLNLMRWLAQEAGDDPLAAIELPDEIALAGVVGVVEPDRLDELQRHMVQQGLIEFVPDDCLRLTPAAWDLLEPPAAAAPAVAPVVALAPIAAAPEAAKIERSDCPQCGPQRRAEVVAFFSVTNQDEASPVYEVVNYNTMRCCGCGDIHVRRDAFFSEDEDHEQNPVTGEWEWVRRPTSTYWPPSERRRKPAWILQVEDDVVHRLLDEIYRALNQDLRTLAAMGVRSLLDRTFELAGADPATGFEEKLKFLTAEGAISARDKETLTIMTDAGSAASHRGWQPDAGALDTILDAAEAVLYRAMVLPRNAHRLQQQVPPKPARKPKVK